MIYPAEPSLRNRTFDRLSKSISGQESDGHGVFFFYTYPFFKNNTNVDLQDYFHNPATAFATQLEVLEMMDKCGSFAPDEGSVAECSALGGTVRFDDHGFISVKEAPINDLEDVLKIKPGNPYGDNYMCKALETLEYMLQHAPKDIKVNPPVIHGPFTVAAQIRGISEFCMDTLVEPEICEALIDVCTETSINFIKAVEKIMGGHLHHILLCDDISSFLSQEQYRKWVSPIYKKIFKEFSGTQMWLHNDAQAGHLISDIAVSGWDAWQYAPSIDPLKAAASGGKMTLMGGLDPVEMQSLTPDQVYEHCTERLKSFGGNNKHVLSPGGSINQIPINNLKAILRAADDFEI